MNNKKRSIEIYTFPNLKDVIVDKLLELGCQLPTVRYFSDVIFGHTIAKIYIWAEINIDKLESLKQWLDSIITNDIIKLV